MSKIFLSFCFIMASLFLPFWVEKSNGAFRPIKVAIEFPFNPSWETDPPSQEVCELFSRPFSYLGRGAQAYVFESEDQAYVLKLFRGSPKSHPAIQFWRHTIRGKRVRSSAEKKIPPLFAACCLAYQKVPALTGLRYMHLNATKERLPKAIFLNRMGKKIPIDLNQCRFVLQRKGVPIQEAFLTAVKENDRLKFTRLAHAFVTMLKERTSKNIGNSDKTLWYNCGFAEETAIEWDFGRYFYNPELESEAGREKEIRIFTAPLQQFLESVAPQWPINLEALF